jgi:hydrogenase maturation protease
MNRNPIPVRRDDFLIIGYGNTLRGDDGAGPHVAETVAARNYPGVRTLVCALLTPELADPISQARVAVFVDAAVDALGEVQLRKLEPAASSQIMSHAADPGTLLALARDVFGRAPEAWWLTIPAVEFDFGGDFSPATQQGVAIALEKIIAQIVPRGAGQGGTGTSPPPRKARRNPPSFPKSRRPMFPRASPRASPSPAE